MAEEGTRYLDLPEVPIEGGEKTLAYQDSRDVLITFGAAAGRNIGTAADQVAAGDHGHSLREVAGAVGDGLLVLVGTTAGVVTVTEFSADLLAATTPAEARALIGVEAGTGSADLATIHAFTFGL